MIERWLDTCREIGLTCFLIILDNTIDFSFDLLITVNLAEMFDTNSGTSETGYKFVSHNIGARLICVALQK